MNNAAVRSLCPQIHKYSPPTVPPPPSPFRFLHSSLSLVRPLSSAPRCFAITWRSHFSSIQQRISSRLLEEYNFLRFLLSSAFEFQGKGEKEPFWKCFATSKLHANSSGRGAGAMSSLLSHSKDQPRLRKTISDSSPTSLAANAKSLRVRPTNVFRVCLLWGMWHRLNTSKCAQSNICTNMHKRVFGGGFFVHNVMWTLDLTFHKFALIALSTSCVENPV